MNAIFHGPIMLIETIILMMIVGWLLIVLGLLWRKLRNVTRSLELKNFVLDDLGTEQSVEKHLNQYLDIIIPTFEATGYYFYLYDQKSNQYVLRMHKKANTSSGRILLSYSSLVPYIKETYDPPLVWPRQNEGEAVSVITDGEVQLVQVLLGGNGLILIGPVRSLTRRIKCILQDIAETLQPALKMLVTLEKHKHDAEQVVATGRVINSLAKSIYDADSLTGKMMLISAGMIEADASCLLLRQDNGYRVPFVTGLISDVEVQLRNDSEGLQKMADLVSTRDWYQLSPTMRDFSKIPKYIMTAGFQSITLVRLDCHSIQGIAAYWHIQAPVIDRHRIEAVQTLLTRLEELFEQQSKYQELTNTYTAALKILVDATDNLKPSTVGHSDLVANYSVAIARQLNLPEQEIQNIRLAGYFHDIGMLGLSNQYITKPSKYSALEFETMKLHAEVGALIIESTLPDVTVATYIRHHHERWDGFGYPLGLQGEEIPLGARIIAVADMFNAKLGGRNYREPVPFEQALTELASSSGTQLDPNVVQALLSWLRKKQAARGRQGKSLGTCWSMRCSPTSICKQCDAYNKKDRNCWEFEKVNCTDHGNKCGTCFVYSEALSRVGQTLRPAYRRMYG